MPTVAALPPEAIVRLAKLLGMLGSNHVGERAAAGLKATELLLANGVTWNDLIQQLNSPAPKHTYNARSRHQPSWRVVAEECLSLHNNDTNPVAPSLTAWEYGFISDILDRGFELSEKQTAVLQRIAGKMGVAFGE